MRKYTLAKFTIFSLFVFVLAQPAFANPFSFDDKTDNLVVARGSSGFLSKISYGEWQRRKHQHKVDLAAMEIRKKGRVKDDKTSNNKSNSIKTENK